MKKKEYLLIIILLSVIALLLSIVAVIVFCKKSQLSEKNDVASVAESQEVDNSTWSIDSLKEGLLTVIDYSVEENGNIDSLEAARKKLSEYGESQRSKYNNPDVVAIERSLEKEYGIYAVNLGEMDIESAKDIEKAVRYMYETYPELEDTLTNITLANIDSYTTGNVAVTDCREYVINGQVTVVPYVMKHEILLSAASFLNRDRLLKKCENGIEAGHWMTGTDISALVVHELGHQLLNACEMREVGFEHPYYITTDNEDAFSRYITDQLKVNQTFAKSVMDEAYNNWGKTNSGKSYEEFCRTISDYATGLQSDGGISYSETFAEAIVDIYLNGDNAAFASKCIIKAVK